MEKRGEYAAVDGSPRLHWVTSYKEHLQNRERASESKRELKMAHCNVAAKAAQYRI